MCRRIAFGFWGSITERYFIASWSYFSVSLEYDPLCSNLIYGYAAMSTVTFMAFFTFHTSITSPTPDEIRIIQDASLSHRYKKMMLWVTMLVKIDRMLSPFIDSTLRQNDMSFLKARKSKTVWRSETTPVTPSSHGLLSKKMPATGFRV